MQSGNSAGNNQWLDRVVEHVVAAVTSAPLPFGFDAREVTRNGHGSFVIVLQTPQQVTYAAEFRAVTKAEYRVSHETPPGWQT